MLPDNSMESHPNISAPPTSCLLCGSPNIVTLDPQAAMCSNCQILMNTNTQALDYSHGGGQAVPDAGKMRWRLLNAEFRFKIIRQFLKNHQFFVDIGCGSGEMLLASKALFPDHIGFDTNTFLIDHIANSLGLHAINSHFNPLLINEELRQKPKAIAMSHVLEHLNEPISLIKQVVDFMSPGDLLYIEVPLHTGKSFREHRYAWNLWYPEHVALYSLNALIFIANKFGLATLDANRRIFARGSRSSKTRIKLFLSNPFLFCYHLATKPRYLSMADVMIGDYGYIVMKK